MYITAEFDNDVLWVVTQVAVNYIECQEFDVDMVVYYSNRLQFNEEIQN